MTQAESTTIKNPTRDRISDTFTKIAEDGRTGLILFLTVGFPDLDATVELVPELVAAGADAIELGVPFSDPLADGPTIQASSFQALQNGVSLESCLGVFERLRPIVPDTPLMLMGYYNPFLRYGLSRFAQHAQATGVDGVIVPDLPPEEAGPMICECEAHNIRVVPLLAPTSTDSRIESACRIASGFVYCVSLTGVTGARDELAAGSLDLLERARRYTDLPLAVGFGISHREQILALDGRAQAAVVGSALIKTLMASPRGEITERARRFVAELSGKSASSGSLE